MGWLKRRQASGASKVVLEVDMSPRALLRHAARDNAEVLAILRDAREVKRRARLRHLAVVRSGGTACVASAAGSRTGLGNE